jgi:hypothetical protein
VIGNKLYNINKELTAAQRKAIAQHCTTSSDKRLTILRTYIQSSPGTLNDLNQFLSDAVESNWPNSSQKEKELKLRRLSSFFVDQIESVLLSTFVDKNSSIKYILLAQALEKSGNLSLINYYYDKAYDFSVIEEDYYYQMIGLKGKIRMSYASQNEKDLSKALQLNEELLKVLRHANNDKVTEYYYNISNIFLEKNSLISNRRAELTQEILEQIELMDYPLNKVSLYVSLAKLNFDNELLHLYFSKAKETLYSVEKRNHDFYDLDRKIRFLELRLEFFSGTNIESLLEMSEDTIEHFKGFSIINNNMLFYRILFCLLHNELEKAERLLEENQVFFRGEGKILENFLQAVLLEKQGELKESLRILQQIMYSTNYFIAVFSRLLYIKVQLKRNKENMIRPVVQSTQRFLQQNSGNALGKDAHQFVLKALRSKTFGNKTKISSSSPTLTVFHEYLLNV